MRVTFFRIHPYYLQVDEGGVACAAQMLFRGGRQVKRVHTMIVTGALALVVATGGARAESWWPVDSGDQQEFAAAYEAMVAAPGDMEAMARYAMAASRIGNFEAAIATLERILLLDPDVDRAKLELGVMYYRIGSHETARYYLEQALAGDGLDAEERARAEDYLDTVKGRLTGHRFSGYATLGLRYRDNANTATSSDEVFLFDFPIPAGEAGDEEDDFNVFLTGRLTHRYIFGEIHPDMWVTRGFFYGSKQFQLEEVDQGVVDVDTGPRFVLLPGVVDGLAARPYVQGSASVVEDDFNNWSGGGGVTISKQFGSALAVQFGGNARYTSFHGVDLGDPDVFFPPDDVEDQNGWTYGTGLGVDFSPNEDVTIRLFGGYAYTDANEDHYSYDRFDAEGSIHYRFDAPYGITLWPWEIAVGGGYRHVDYVDPNPRIDSTREREDDRWDVWVRQTVGLAEEWYVFAEGRYTKADSNIPNYDFDNLSALGGVTWRF